MDEIKVDSSFTARIANGETYSFYDFTFTTDVVHEFIKVNVILEYAEYGETENIKAPIIRVKATYRLVKDHEFIPDELGSLLTRPTALLIERLQQLPYNLLPKDHQLPDHLKLRNVSTQMDRLAQELNQKSSHLP